MTFLWTPSVKELHYKNTVISPNFWCVNFVERHSFRIVSGDFHKRLCWNCAFPQNFHTRKLGEITLFFTLYFRKFAFKRPIILSEMKLIFSVYLLQSRRRQFWVSNSILNYISDPLRFNWQYLWYCSFLTYLNSRIQK